MWQRGTDFSRCVFIILRIAIFITDSSDNGQSSQPPWQSRPISVTHIEDSTSLEPIQTSCLSAGSSAIPTVFPLSPDFLSNYLARLLAHAAAPSRRLRAFPGPIATAHTQYSIAGLIV